ncbi:uncharacterized protein [Nicotiana sylvestris]|uniref:uncharacterized protein n=1 Tax=Nicotiana sylvestris TaxID=4096 RepID=UPI00388CDF68
MESVQRLRDGAEEEEEEDFGMVARVETGTEIQRATRSVGAEATSPRFDKVLEPERGKDASPRAGVETMIKASRDEATNDPVLQVHQRLEQIKDLQSKIDEVRAEAKKFKGCMDILASKKEVVQEKLDSAESQLLATREKVSVQARKIEELQSNLANLAKELEVVRSEADATNTKPQATTTQYKVDAKATLEQAKGMTIVLPELTSFVGATVEWYHGKVKDLAGWVRQLDSIYPYDKRVWCDLDKGRWEAKKHVLGDASSMREDSSWGMDTSSLAKEKKIKRKSLDKSPKSNKAKSQKPKADSAALSLEATESPRAGGEEGDDSLLAPGGKKCAMEIYNRALAKSQAESTRYEEECGRLSSDAGEFRDLFTKMEEELNDLRARFKTLEKKEVLMREGLRATDIEILGLK